MFDIQKFARSDVTKKYNGRRRLSGNYGKVYIGGIEIFEISSFEAKITVDRDEVIIGISKDSKVTGLTGEGSVTVKKVSTRGFNKYLTNQQKGYDERFTIIAEISDPDTINGQEERVKLENVWFNEFDLVKFEKGAVVEAEIPFGFTPEDVTYEKAITVSDSEFAHESH